MADITGVYGLSWLVVFGNTVIYGFIRNFCRRSGAAVLAACIICALLYGYWRCNRIDELQNRNVALNVGLIQGNIAQDQKWDRGFTDETIGVYGRLSLECSKGKPGFPIYSFGPNLRCLFSMRWTKILVLRLIVLQGKPESLYFLGALALSGRRDGYGC